MIMKFFDLTKLCKGFICITLQPIEIHITTRRRKKRQNVNFSAKKVLKTSLGCLLCKLSTQMNTRSSLQQIRRSCSHGSASVKAARGISQPTMYRISDQKELLHNSNLPFDLHCYYFTSHLA